ncbi:MAG: PAS domain S-box protein [Anaerolineales bacterium]|nr:PAS domain S-box protein [Anaerolineales bacterium]
MEGKRLTILMVEDNFDHIELARRAFEFACSGDQFFACCTVKETLEWLQNHQADVIIADLHLPDGSGLELLEHPAINGNLPAVIITNQGDEARAVQAIQRGALDYLVKGAETFLRIPLVAHRVYEQWRVIEAKKEAEEKLRQHEILLNGILQGTRDGYLLIDVGGKFLEVNRAYANLLGYSPEELIGKTIADVEAVQTAEQIAAIVETIRHQGSALFETLHRHRDGHLIDVEVSMTYLPEQGGRMVAFVRDVSERIAMQNALRQAKDHIERQLGEMTILRNIDLAITAHHDSQKIIQILLEQVSQLQGILGACLLIRNSHESSWRLQASLPKGVDCQTDHLPYWLQVELEQLVLHSQPRFVQLDSSATSALPALFSTCASLAILPLIKHQQLSGSMLLFAAPANFFDAEWSDFAKAIATQTTIGLENAHLYEALSQKHQELLEAYQATLEAWSRTLEIRDKDTQGHTHRVVEISLKLAQAFGLAEEELEVLRRGAMLHDIGKIQVPDTILLKPSKLDESEWEIMRQHPLYAREMIQGIRILEEAVDIPLYHHERWDGEGYPYGLKGEEIPFSARLFAVADVWDALTSDCPYRPAWTKEAAVEYIRKQAGFQFDPRVVEVFLRLLEAGEIS